VERYYEGLLAEETNTNESKEHNNSNAAPRKWKKQIEKVIRCMHLGFYGSIF
jgi:hypothetical protein